MITQVRLRNFKIFPSLIVDLAPMSVFTGINGVGKSTVLQSLLLLKQSYEIKYLQSRGQVDLHNDFINLETADDLCNSFAADDDRVVEIALTVDGGKTHRWRIDANESTHKVLPCKYIGDGSYDHISLFSKDFIFLDADRWGPKSIYHKKESRAYNTVLGIQGELAPAYLQNSIQTNEKISISELKYLDENLTLGLYENVNLWLSAIIGASLKTTIYDIDESSLKLNYSTSGSKGISYSAVQIGFGITYTLPIIIAILRAKKGDLIIIENPESHLHPGAQSRLGNFLAMAAECGIQMIVETHSEHIVNGIRLRVAQKRLNPVDVKIHFFSQNISHSNYSLTIQEVGVDEIGELTEWPTNFFDQSEIDLLEILKARRK